VSTVMSKITVPAPAVPDKYDQREMVDAIKQTVCKGATDAQLRMFIEVCRTTGLNPWLREVWFVAEKSMIMAGRDGYLRVANEHPAFDGIETRVERDDKQIPIKAVCTVWRKDRTHPTICEAYFSEYKSASPVWTKYPSAMISKVAEVLALKRSFAINGVVSEEEMDATVNPISQPTPQAVADSKIAQMKSGVPYAQTTVPAYQATDEDVPHPAEPEPMEQATAQIKRRMEQFAKMKAAIGNPEYYRIIGVHGYTHANEIRSLTEARAIYREMAEVLDYQQANPGEVAE
jgi:phage recombination protein Bet